MTVFLEHEVERPDDVNNAIEGVYEAVATLNRIAGRHDQPSRALAYTASVLSRSLGRVGYLSELLGVPTDAFDETISGNMNAGWEEAHQAHLGGKAVH